MKKTTQNLTDKIEFSLSKSLKKRIKQHAKKKKVSASAFLRLAAINAMNHD